MKFFHARVLVSPRNYQPISKILQLEWGTIKFISKYMEIEIFQASSSNLLKNFKNFAQSSKLFDEYRIALHL